MKRIIFLTIIFFIFNPILAKAANFFWQQSDNRVCLFLNTEDTSVNAISGIVSLQNLSVKNFSEASSIINFWLKKPSANGGEIEGIIPSGFSGSDGRIGCFDLENIVSEAVIGLSEVKVFLNDGNGTELVAPETRTVIPSDKEISQVTTTQINQLEKADLYPPENFSPLIATESEMFSGKKFIVFATEDKNSGIDHYEVLESDFAWKQKNGTIKPLSLRSWKIKQSPYVLRDQDLESFVFVRAVDRAGNVREVVMEPTVVVRWYERNYMVGVLVFGLVIILSAAYFINRRK